MPDRDADDLALLIRAAQDAGAIALRFWRNQPQAWDKDAGAGPVTEADLAVNDRLMSDLRAARPGYGWLSEESPDDPARMAAERCFIVDPIDGTRAFIDGQEGFAIAIAVVEAGRPVAGVVHLPARATTYAARRGGPALRDGDVIQPADAAQIDDARVLTTRSSTDPALWRGGTVPPFRREFRPSLAWRLCLVAEGRFDAALSLRPVWDWDIAAASLIAERAGCLATDRHGRALAFNAADPRNPGLIVAPPALHGQIIAALAPADEVAR